MTTSADDEPSTADSTTDGPTTNSTTGAPATDTPANDTPATEQPPAVQPAATTPVTAPPVRVRRRRTASSWIAIAVFLLMIAAIVLFAFSVAGHDSDSLAPPTATVQ